MRTVLQNLITRMYFAGGSDWTTDSDEAFDFHDARGAAEFVRNEAIESDLLEIVMIFSNSRYNAVVSAADPFQGRTLDI